MVFWQKFYTHKVFSVIAIAAPMPTTITLQYLVSFTHANSVDSIIVDKHVLQASFVE